MSVCLLSMWKMIFIYKRNQISLKASLQIRSSPRGYSLDRQNLVTEPLIMLGVWLAEQESFCCLCEFLLSYSPFIWGFQVSSTSHIRSPQQNPLHRKQISISFLKTDNLASLQTLKS